MELHLPYRFAHEKRNPVTGRFEKGHIPANKGKQMSEETRIKVSRTWFKKGYISERKYYSRGKKSIPIEMLKDGKIVGVFESIGQAGKKTGIQRRNINAVILGDRKKAGGFEWRKADINYFKKYKNVSLSQSNQTTYQ